MTTARVPPHSLEAETAVLGGILLQNAVLNVVTEIITPDDFYSEGHRILFATMLALFGRGAPVDTVTVRTELATKGQLAQVGGDEALLALTNTIPTVANIEAHASIVKEKSLVRRLITSSHEIGAKGYSDYGDVQQFLDSAEKAVFEISKVSQRHPYEHIKPIIRRSFEAITKAAERKESITGLTTGFEKLDEYTAGMHPGELIIIAGRPGMGKTSFALNVAVNACHERRVPVLICSLEMPKEQLAHRMMCSEARIDASRMRTGRLTRDDWPELARAAGYLSDLPISIDDTPGLTIMELRGKSRRFAAEAGGIGLIVVDYLQLMRAGGRVDSREQEISEISRSLKGLAKEMGIPVIALSQLNRAVETRGTKDKRPQLSDLRESGAIEQDADTIMFIYRDEAYNKDSLDRGIAEIIIGKQRSGPTGTVRTRFFHEYTRFDNLEPGEYGGDPGFQ